MFKDADIAQTFPMIGEMKSWYGDPKEQGRRIRALTTTYPGGADQLFLELWTPGEFDGWELKKRVEAKGAWANSVEILDWDGARLLLRDAVYEAGWSEADKRAELDHFWVPFSFSKLGKKAKTMAPEYYDRAGAAAS